MLNFQLSSYPERTGAHYSVGISPPYDYSKKPEVIKKYGKRRANGLKGKGFVLVQLQDERAEQVRCRLTPTEARHMARELRQFANELGKCRRTLGMNQGQLEKRKRQLR